MSNFLILLLTLVCLTLFLPGIYSIKYSDCGSSNNTTIWNVNVLNCDNLDVCKLVRGNKATLDVDFTTDLNSNHAKMLVNGKIYGVFLPFTFQQKDACQNSGLECPLESKKNYTYHAKVDVKKIYPTVDVDLRFKLVDADNKKVVFCIIVPSKVV